MRPLPKFEYHNPNSTLTAVKLLDSLENAKVFIGGTDLLPQIRDQVLQPEHLINLNNIAELCYVKELNGQICIGSTTPLRNVVNSPHVKKNFLALYDAVSIMGSPQIRNRASITGNICNASPAADSAPPLYVHNAEVIIKSLHRTKALPINELFLGPKINCLQPNELLTEIRIPIPRQNSSSSFLRIGRRKAFTLSVVSAATYLEMESRNCIDARIALGSIASTPIRVQVVEEILKDRELTPELINEASELSKECVMPITDIRGTADYRKDMCKVLVKRTIYHSLRRLRVTI